MSCPLTMLSTASQQKAPMDSAGGGNDSSVDARTKETAATLLGVAAFNNGPQKAPAPGPTITKPAEAPSDNRPTPTSILDHPSTQPQQQKQQKQHAPTLVPHHPPPAPRYGQSAAGPPPSYHLHPPPPPPPTYHNVRPPHQVETAAHHLPATTTATATATTEANTALSMSSIGFGIDSSGTASWGDATDAAVRALQDAMERSTLRLPMAMPSQHLLQIKVQLGVPSKQLGSHEPMIVDVNRLTAILPRAIPVLPIRVVVGGLYIAGETPGSPSICTAVACVTLQSLAALTVPEPSTARSHAPTNIPQSSPWASLEGHTPVSVAPAPGPTSAPPPAPVVAAGPPPPQSAGDTRQAKVIPSAPDAAIASTAAANGNVHRSSSIEMLARISEEIRVAGGDASNHKAPNGFVVPNSIADGQATAAMQQHHLDLNGAVNGYDVMSMEYDDAQFRNGNYNYKKLPPGITTKNNRRLFVKHQYRDHSFEKPLPEERDLVGNHPGASPSARTPNAAFPLKLHETLSQIENNGHSDIIGWMPHGRSFKIHKQKEFAEVILPRYFVMTKKSSFLRQLNLYGFNRFSAGLDQGSYYHEKFLRGMKFLCRRMTRQKVNGNRIRSAGNPDEEPDLSSFPSCPNPQAPSSKMSNNFIMPPISSATAAGASANDGQQLVASSSSAAAAEDSEEYDDEKSDASPANGALQKATAV